MVKIAPSRRRLFFALFCGKIEVWNPPDVDTAKSRRPVHIVTVDDFSAGWLRVKAEAEPTTEVIISELVREKIAALA